MHGVNFIAKKKKKKKKEKEKKEKEKRKLKVTSIIGLSITAMCQTVKNQVLFHTYMILALQFSNIIFY